MRKRLFSKIILILGFIVVVNSASAQTVYVIDNLIITMRTGQSTQHSIVKTWPSNTRLEVLETGDKYSRVKGPGDLEGWVLNQYISPKPTAKIRLAAAEKKLARLEAENAQLKSDMNKVSGSEAGLSKELKEITSKYKKQTDELTRLRSVAAKPLKLENENQKLKKELLDLENEHELLRQESQMLRDSSDRDWFLNGALVIIAGIIIGLIAPRLKPRKKTSWGSL
ncbi:TIGR04211 family SH3 domain-containing protein [Kaarinaea lacus]